MIVRGVNLNFYKWVLYRIFTENMITNSQTFIIGYILRRAWYFYTRVVRPTPALRRIQTTIWKVTLFTLRAFTRTLLEGNRQYILFYFFHTSFCGNVWPRRLIRSDVLTLCLWSENYFHWHLNKNQVPDKGSSILSCAFQLEKKSNWLERSLY